MKRWVEMLLVLLVVHGTLTPDVTSVTGEIEFHIDENNDPSMILDATGLAIGSSNASTNLFVSGNAIFSEELTIGQGVSGSNLNANGTIGYSFETISSDMAIGDHSVVIADTSLGNVVVTLPYAGNVEGAVYSVKKASSLNELYFLSDNLIDGSSLLKYDDSATGLPSIRFISSGGQWHIIYASDNLENHVIAEYFNGYGSVTDDIVDLTSSESSQGWTSDWQGSQRREYAAGGLTFTNANYDDSLNLQGANDGFISNDSADNTFWNIYRSFIPLRGTIWISFLARSPVSGTAGLVLDGTVNSPSNSVSVRPTTGLIVRYNGSNNSTGSVTAGVTYLVLVKISNELLGRL